MLFQRLLFFSVITGFACTQTQAATVLVLRFHNQSQHIDLNWVGESIAETLRSEFGEAGEIVLDRSARNEGLRRLSLKPDSDYTKATLLKLGQTLDADYLYYGNYEADLPSETASLRDSSIKVSAHFLDLRKMHEGPVTSEAGKLAELSRLEEHLAWQALKYLQPQANLNQDLFLSPRKLIRVDAKESYIRGLLSSSKAQQEKWFTQAVSLDANFTSPAFELGNLSLERKDYKASMDWFRRIASTDSRYLEARFKMGLSAYGIGDYSGAAKLFREELQTVPLSEVYNDLGAAEDRLNLPVAIDDFRHALDGDQNDVVYLFNLGSALLKNGYFEESIKRLEAVIARSPDEADAADLLARAQRHEKPAVGTLATAQLLKNNLDLTAYRQLKAMLQPKGN